MLTNAMCPIHPGEILREELEELGCSARELARALDVPVNLVTGIFLRKERGIIADTALRLARYFNSSQELWLNLQSAYDLRQTQRTVGKKIVRAVRPCTAA